MRRNHSIIVVLLTFALFSCTSYQNNPNIGKRYKSITRKEVIEIAEAYLGHKWRPTSKNIFHGLDQDGIQVDTPDIEAGIMSGHPGWWVPNSINVGLPYKWGGFCTLEDFDRGINEGKYAGDVYSQYKRKNLRHAISKYAVGVDCSGFVSRCWGLSFPHSTRYLSTISSLLLNFSELKPGDIINKHNYHVYIFKEFFDEEKTIVTVIHASMHKVKQEQLFVQDLAENGFKPYRYFKIVD